MDWKYDEWQRRYGPQEPVTVPVPAPTYVPYVPPGALLPTREEIEEFHRLLERAREYDRKMNQPDCELDEKRKKLRELARLLGVEINFI